MEVVFWISLLPAQHTSTSSKEQQLFLLHCALISDRHCRKQPYENRGRSYCTETVGDIPHSVFF